MVMGPKIPLTCYARGTTFVVLRASCQTVTAPCGVVPRESFSRELPRRFGWTSRGAQTRRRSSNPASRTPTRALGQGYNYNGSERRGEGAAGAEPTLLLLRRWGRRTEPEDRIAPRHRPRRIRSRRLRHGVGARCPLGRAPGEVRLHGWRDQAARRRHADAGVRELLQVHRGHRHRQGDAEQRRHHRVPGR